MQASALLLQLHSAYFLRAHCTALSPTRLLPLQMRRWMSGWPSFENRGTRLAAPHWCCPAAAPLAPSTWRVCPACKCDGFWIFPGTLALPSYPAHCCCWLKLGAAASLLQGIVKALLDANLLPRVVSGSSAGSIGGRHDGVVNICSATAQAISLGAGLPGTNGRSSHPALKALTWLPSPAVSAIICTRTESVAIPLPFSVHYQPSPKPPSPCSVGHHLHAHRIRGGRSV